MNELNPENPMETAGERVDELMQEFRVSAFAVIVEEEAFRDALMAVWLDGATIVSKHQLNRLSRLG